MAITSHGYFNDVIPGVIAARLFTYATNHRFWCYNQDAVEVLPLTGGTREVQISIGEFGAFGIYNSNNSVATVQLPAPVSEGTQWYLLSATHTWADELSETTFEAIHCGSVAQRPAGYTVDPGNKITMPLAYVPITFGQSDPGTPIDLRAMGTASGDMLVKNDHALSYLGYAGMSVWMGKTHYNRVLTSSGNNHEWRVDPGPWGKVNLTSTTWFGGAEAQWSSSGLGSRAIRDGNTVHITLRIRKTTGGNISIPTGDVVDTPMFVLDPAWRPDESLSGLACSYVNQGLGNNAGIVTVASNGVISFTAGTPGRDLRVMPSGSWSLSTSFTFVQES